MQKVVWAEVLLHLPCCVFQCEVSKHSGPFQEVAPAKPPPRKARAERAVTKEDPDEEPPSPFEEKEVKEREAKKDCKKEKKEESRDLK